MNTIIKLTDILPVVVLVQDWDEEWDLPTMRRLAERLYRRGKSFRVIRVYGYNIPNHVLDSVHYSHSDMFGMRTVTL